MHRWAPQGFPRQLLFQLGSIELRQAGQNTLQAEGVGVAGAIRAAVGSAPPLTQREQRRDKSSRATSGPLVAHYSLSSIAMSCAAQLPNLLNAGAGRREAQFG